MNNEIIKITSHIYNILHCCVSHISYMKKMSFLVFFSYLPHSHTADCGFFTSARFRTIQYTMTDQTKKVSVR